MFKPGSLALRPVRQFAVQGQHQFLQRDVRIHVEAQGHRAVAGQHGLPQVDLFLGNAEIGIGQQYAQQEQAVGGLDQVGQGLFPGNSHIRAPEVHGLSRQQTLAHERGDDRYAQFAAQPGNLLFQPVTADFHPNHEHRGTRPSQGFNDLTSAGVQGIGITVTGQRQYGHWVTGFEHLVPGHFDVNGAGFDNTVPERPGDLLRRLHRIFQDHLVAGHLSVHLHL